MAEQKGFFDSIFSDKNLSRVGTIWDKGTDFYFKNKNTQTRNDVSNYQQQTQQPQATKGMLGGINPNYLIFGAVGVVGLVFIVKSK